MPQGSTTLSVGTVPTPALYFAAIRVRDRWRDPDHGLPQPARVQRHQDECGMAGRFTERRSRRCSETIEGGRASRAGRGESRDAEILDRYVEEIVARSRVEAPVRMVLDCGNGAGSVIAVRALQEAGVDVDGLYCESDGTFPNHHPDPTRRRGRRGPASPAYARRGRVRRGLGRRRRPDRRVTENGEIVAGTLLAAVRARRARRTSPGPRSSSTSSARRRSRRCHRASGGVPIMWKTGHSLIKERMKAGGSPIAGEMSGHICFADRYLRNRRRDLCRGAAGGADRAERAARSRSWRREIPAYPSTPELRLDCHGRSRSSTSSSARSSTTSDPRRHRHRRCSDALRRGLGARSGPATLNPS